MPTRVYISFDYDYDATLKEFLVGQSKLADSPFEISDTSITVATPNWKQVARNRIKSSDTVAVICGEHTHTATGVTAEVEIAQDESVSYFLLKGYKDKTCYKPTSAYASDELYKWTWDNLKLLVGGARA